MNEETTTEPESNTDGTAGTTTDNSTSQSTTGEYEPNAEQQEDVREESEQIAQEVVDLLLESSSSEAQMMEGEVIEPTPSEQYLQIISENSTSMKDQQLLTFDEIKLVNAELIETREQLASVSELMVWNTGLVFAIGVIYLIKKGIDPLLR